MLRMLPEGSQWHKQKLLWSSFPKVCIEKTNLSQSCGIYSPIGEMKKKSIGRQLLFLLWYTLYFNERFLVGYVVEKKTINTVLK